MAHDISVKDGVAEVFVGDRLPAWHKLGTHVATAQNWREAMKLAHLEWSVSKHNLLSPFDNFPLMNAWGIFRDDTKELLSQCGSSYTPIQNETAFDFVDHLIEAENGAHYVSAGALDEGRKIWCLAKLPQNIEIKGTDDVSKTYMLFTDFRKPGRSATAKLTSVRVVCQNTLSQALADGNSMVRIRHSGNAMDKIAEAKKVLLQTKDDVSVMNDKMNELAVRKMNQESFAKVLTDLFPEIQDKPRQQEVARDILVRYEHNDGNAFPTERGTAYNLLNAVTEHIDHYQTVRGANGSEELIQLKRAENALFGKGDQFKQKALDSILENTIHNERKSETIYFDMQHKTVDSILEMTAGIGKEA